MTLTQRVEELTISCANESKRNIGAFKVNPKVNPLVKTNFG